VKVPLHILGAGSIGLLLATHLAPSTPLRLIRRGPAAPTLRVSLAQGDAQRMVELAQAAAQDLAAPLRRVIVCTKAYDALPALEALRGKLAPDVALLLMQNGMGSQQAVAAAFPAASVYAASSTEGAYRTAPDRVVHAGRGVTRIGRLAGPAQDWVALLRSGGLAAEPAEPIAWHLANKLRVNALINPLTVLHGCRNGELLERPQALAAMRRLGEEADRVLRTAGFEFPEPAFDRAAEVARATAANHSSMLQDARAGRRLEIDYINGYLARLAVELEVPAPAHAAVIAELAGVAKPPLG
jgi:2-dehydropantoate 2-reductase